MNDSDIYIINAALDEIRKARKWLLNTIRNTSDTAERLGEAEDDATLQRLEDITDGREHLVDAERKLTEAELAFIDVLRGVQ